MIDLIDAYYSKEQSNTYGNYGDCDSNKVSISALSAVIPLIIKNDLTERQQACIKMKYVLNLSQPEIARRLHLSQPTVCRHIRTAKEVLNNRLAYCITVLNKANSLWIESEKYIM